MKIQTLGGGLLYQVHRKKDRMLARMERRKAFGYIAAIMLCVGIALWIIYYA